MQILFFIFLLAICASFIQRVSGFGFGIFVMIFFPLFLPSYGEATTLSGLLAGSTALIIAIRYFRHIKWGIMLPLLLINIVTSFFAIEYMTTLSNEILKRCFGGVFIAIALYFLFLDSKKSVRLNWASKGLLGALSGIMGGMFAMPGPPLVVCCINSIKSNIAYVVTLQAFSVLLNIFYTIFRARVGFFNENTLHWWAIGMIGAFIGSWLGERLFSHISSAMLRKIVYTLLLVSGIFAII